MIQYIFPIGAVVLAIILSVAGKKVKWWLGLIGVVVVGAITIIVGAASHPLSIRLIVWGIGIVVASMIAIFWGRAHVSPTMPTEDSFGTTMEHLPTGAWLTSLGIFVACLIIGFIVGPNK